MTTNQHHCDGNHPRDFLEGLRLFNERHYFEAHEVWEDVWRATAGDERDFYQGLIHLTVALYQAHRANWKAAHSQLRRACRRLARFEPTWRGVALRVLRDRAADAVLRLQARSLDVRLPAITLTAAASRESLPAASQSPPRPETQPR